MNHLLEMVQPEWDLGPITGGVLIVWHHSLLAAISFPSGWITLGGRVTTMIMKNSA